MYVHIWYELGSHASPTDNASRVVLRTVPTGSMAGLVQGSDYINASFVDVRDTSGYYDDTFELLPSPQGYKQRNAYIATQGPLQNTVEDFWRMVWEFKSMTIVMLCGLTEEGCESSYCYWPTEEGAAVSYGSISVTLQSQLLYDSYEVRTLAMREKVGDHSCAVVGGHEGEGRRP